MIRWMHEPAIILRRHPDAEDEPSLLHLEIAVTNGVFGMRQSFFLATEDFERFGAGLSGFPANASDRPTLTCGNANARDQSPFVSLTAYLDGLQSALSCKLADRSRWASLDGEVSFSIRTEAHAINRLGSLVQEFARLQHSDLIWTTKSGELFAEPNRDAL